MMTAKEALEKTKAVHLGKIEQRINSAIEAGFTEVEIVQTELYISKENIEILKRQGFDILEKESMAGKEVKIIWEKPKESYYA